MANLALIGIIIILLIPVVWFFGYCWVMRQVANRERKNIEKLTGGKPLDYV